MGFTTAAALVQELMEARNERRLLNLQRQMSRLNLLIIDEMGFVPLSRTGAELLLEVFSQRYERGSVMVTTNLPFDEWTEVFGSERLTGALLDRPHPPRPHPGDERRELQAQAQPGERRLASSGRPRRRISPTVNAVSSCAALPDLLPSVIRQVIHSYSATVVQFPRRHWHPSGDAGGSHGPSVRAMHQEQQRAYTVRSPYMSAPVNGERLLWLRRERRG